MKEIATQYYEEDYSMDMLEECKNSFPKLSQYYFVDLDCTMTTKIESGNNSLSLFNTRKLLDEVSVLLDRCWSNRLLKRELEAKLSVLICEKMLFEKTSEVHKKQIANGLYEHEFNISKKEVDLHTANIANSNIIKDSIVKAKRWREETHDKVEERKKYSAILAQGMSPQAAANNLIEPARKLVQNQLDYERNDLDINLYQNDMQTKNDELQLAIAKEKKKFLEKNKVSLQEIFNNECSIKTQYYGLAIQSGHGLNYAEQIILATKMFEIDANCLYSRVKRLYRSVLLIFGILHPLPNIGIQSYLEDLIVWYRKVVEELSKIQEKQIEFIHTVSMKELLGENFIMLLQGKVQNFNIDSIHFNGLNCVRMSKVSINLKTNGSFHGVLRASIQTPQDSYIVTPQGTNNSLAQKEIPCLFFGDLRERSDPHSVSACVTNYFDSASPYGKWQVKLLKSPANSIVEQIRDIEINLYINAIPSGTQHEI